MKLARPSNAGHRALRLGARLLPLGLLGLQILVSFQLLGQTGSLDPLDPRSIPDARSYWRGARIQTLEAALADHRTMGYPAFLRVMKSAGQTGVDVPRVQAKIYFAAATVFFLGLWLYSGSRWLALAAATPLVWASSHEFLRWDQTDSLAVSLTLMTFGSLLMLAARPGSPWAWGAVTLGVLAAYHVRPATTFLIVLVPALGLVLRMCRSGTRLRQLRRWGLGIGAATLLPFLLFATLRWGVVGHFGLVSFSGANLIGLAASFIDPEVVDALPPEQALLAERILARRENRGWQPMTGNSDPAPYFHQYNFNVWKIAVPTTHRRLVQLTAGTDNPVPPLRRNAPRDTHWVAKDRMMLELSREIIRLRPYLYLNWVFQAFGHARKELFQDGWLVWPLLLLAISMPFAWLYGDGGRSPTGTGQPRADGAGRHVLLGLLLLAVGYFASYMALVCLVSYPISRYAIAAALFLPPLLCALLFDTWRRIALRLGR